ncbi:MAG: L-seryl-tRNA(Sec) selenium transferase [Hyphomicrobiales bacterium]
MKNATDRELITSLPSVDRLLRADEASQHIAEYGRAEVTAKIRETLQYLRDVLRDGREVDVQPSAVLAAVHQRLAEDAQPSLRPILNLTGTVVHTNLGRAMLPEVAIDAVSAVARGASNLEYDLARGKRGNRDSHLEDALKDLTGAEAAIVVNNNAAAVMLVLNTLALGQKVPVSRGELVEIGGSFRIPEIMSRSGCELIEVGTTNRTHLRDYAQAICDETALIMKVHASNYVIDGFTASVPESEIGKLCQDNEIPFVIDLGAGSLVNLEDYGLPHEPTPREALKNGADLVTFSGDKLLGGPQAGIIVGKKGLVDQLKSNPMKRALRCDKMTIAALAEVLRLYRNPDRLSDALPTLRVLTRSIDDLNETADKLIEPLSSAFSGLAEIAVIDCDSVIGSGALPSRTVASRGLSIRPVDHVGSSAIKVEAIAKAFAHLPVPVIGRVHHGAFILDLRCLENADDLFGLIEHLEFQT